MDQEVFFQGEMPNNEMDAIESIDASLRRHLRSVKAKKANLLELKANKKMLEAKTREVGETLQIHKHELSKKEKQLIELERQNEKL